MTATTPYQEHVIHAKDVCNNCFSLLREERIDAYKSNDIETDSYYSWRDETTEEGYPPFDIPAQCRSVFCECGVENARDRIWDYTEPSRERFKALLQNALTTLDQKGVTVARKQMVAHAIQAYDEGHNVDGAIEAGLDAGLAVATSTDCAPAE